MAHKIAAANWKMNGDLNFVKQLTQELLANQTIINSNQSLLLASPFLYLHELVEATKNYKQINIAAQNCAQYTSGAYTGEVSADMLASIGVTHVIIGHSERRALFGETDAQLAIKVLLAIQNKLKPVFCIGETLAQREANKHFNIIEDQLWHGLFQLSEADFSQCIVAYEPVWAIGTGVTATPEQAQEMHAYIRGLIAEKYNDDVAQATSILYGGSCNEKNAATLFSLPDVDGGLVGGASLKAESFAQIVAALNK
ncbi:MAG: triose-phosphate isomerase [Bacteroidia bacterium]|nr:triose-phosphate isomerase [Bacteroidia bacterium]HQV00381.1 triose-phosphate isomerase [Bacteroidia bacterium]